MIVYMTFPSMQTNVYTLIYSYAHLRLDVTALIAALLLLNQEKGYGRLVRERRQQLSFCLEVKRVK